MSFPPEAYLIGAQKAGTTTLAYLLDQNPLVTMSSPKEPHFFTHNWYEGLDWYREKFSGPPNTIWIDASTSYAMAPLSGTHAHRREEEYKGVPDKVFSVNPNAKLIYLLRDPVERAYSGYWHEVRMGVENEDFATALLKDSLYLDTSNYYEQLLLWLQFFSLSSFLFILFEDLKDDPERVTTECWKFLEVDEGAIPVRLDSAKNQGYQASWVGRSMNRMVLDYPALRTALKPVVPKSVQGLLKRAKTGSTPIPEMKEEDRNFLLEYFREKNTNLATLTGQSLDKW